MSISPPDQQEDKSSFVIMNASAAVNRTSKAFFGDPLHYIFLIGLTGLMIGLLFGAHFRGEFYALLLILAVVQFTRFIYRGKFVTPPASGDA